MNGDPKVVVALAVAVLMLAPVVNAIMAKAAEQADLDWLRDEPLELQPPDDGRPREANGEGDLQPPPGEGPRPRTDPPPQRPPQRCTMQQRGSTTTLGPADAIAGSTHVLELETAPGDLAVLIRIQAQDLSGSPRFVLSQDGDVVWEHQEQHVHANFQIPDGEGAVHEPGAPGTAWQLRLELGRTVFTTLSAAIGAQHCAEAAR